MSHNKQRTHSSPVRVVTFGTFDLTHIGHIRLLRRAAALGDELHVGVSTDALTKEKRKGRETVFDEATRMEFVDSIKGVTSVFREESLDRKQDYIDQVGADLLVMGDDWKGKFDSLKVDSIIYLPRTEGVSTTSLRNGESVGSLNTPKQK